MGIAQHRQTSNLPHRPCPASLRALIRINLPHRFKEEEELMMLILDQISLDFLFYTMIPPVVGKRRR
jgi:hypothetical protein